ncbi:MAG: hypothetical protein KC417_13815, partial [Myxococcales bacterium]|nr:hypothetical protein [Myxococcales bacterium]
MSPAVLRTRAEPVRHDTFRYDAGVFAVGAVGLTVMAVSSVALGGVIALGAPVLAKVFRDRANEELRAKAVSEVPRVVQRMAEQLADNFDREIARWASDVTASARAS